MFAFVDVTHLAPKGTESPTIPRPSNRRSTLFKEQKAALSCLPIRRKNTSSHMASSHRR
jgi:hypothetical protein